MNRGKSIALHAAVVSAVAAASIAVSLWVTPMQQVSAAGQTVQVGVAGPSWRLSGPGELDLFGQHIPTTIQFAGPVRPRLSLTRITLSEQLSQLTTRSPDAAASSLEQALVRGWEHYFLWQVLVVALAAVLLLGAAAGWLRHGRKRTLLLIAVGVVAAEAINLGAIMTTAYTAPGKLGRISSLQDLVGGVAPPTARPRSAPADPNVERVVVLGDSTAAGQGNRMVPHARRVDRVCHRSADAFAADLALANDWAVTNLACSSATIGEGLLGPQLVGSRSVPPQIDSPEVGRADAIVVSIGANDLRWSDVLQLCAVTPSCSNPAAQAYFQQQLAGFSRDLLALLSDLQVLPGRPVVVVNQYYDPFTGDPSCLPRAPITPENKRTLEGDLQAMNTILAKGAQAAGFVTARPNFDGHGLCSPLPYVQGPSDRAPFHPTASGQLAIALADEQALQAGSS